MSMSAIFQRQKERHLFAYLFWGFVSLVVFTFLLRVAFAFIAPEPLSHLSTSQAVYALFWGIRFDLASAALPMVLISLGSYIAVRVFKARNLPYWPFTLTMALFAISQCCDTAYFIEASRHSGYEIWDVFNDASGLSGTLVKTHYWLLLFMVVLVVASLAIGFGRKVKVKPASMATDASLLCFLIIATISIRGGIFHRPMRPMRVVEIGNDNMAALAENPNYSIMYTLFSGEKITPVYQSFPKLDKTTYQAEIRKHFIDHGSRSLTPPTKKYNVILFALESWPAWLMDDKSHGQPVTPNFDRLAKTGFSTDGLIAEGHRTAEGLFAMLCSYPNPLGDAILDNQLIDRHYHCLPEMLSKRGWNTAIFQGMHTGIVGAMTQKLGVTHSYGKLDIKVRKHPDNTWGADDNDYFNYILKHAKEDSKPFFYVINNTNTHENNLPDGIPYVFGTKTSNDKFQSVLHYSDAALGRFVKGLRKVVTRPTLLVLTADHTRGPMPNRLQRYHTPFALVILNGNQKPSHVPTLASQRDVAPTILHWLGGNAPWFTGQSLWNLPEKDYHGTYYTGGMYGWMQGTRLIEFPLAHPGKLNCFNWSHQKLDRVPAQCSPADHKSEKEARAYMDYTQTLLFNGETTAFGSPKQAITQQVAKD